MGKKAKSSRKGKKAWRANISTEDIEDYFDKSTKDALSGGSLSNLPSESLFYVDKSRDLSVKRKIEKSREKVLHCDSLLQRNPFIQPVPSSVQKKKVSKKHSKPFPGSKDKEEAKTSQKYEGVSGDTLVDLWDDKGKDKLKSSKKPKTSVIPAVEVEHPGCSFNPDPESHQDALAHAVADEMQKIYRDELGPEPIPLTVPGKVMDEEDIYFLEADDGNDDDEYPNVNMTNNGDADQEKRPLKTERLTRVELNRRSRKKEQLRAEAEAKRLKEFSKEIDHLPDILQEIAKEDEEKQKRHLRRTVARQEKMKVLPPRLGKHKFQAAPIQVLLSEEKTGSLRQLKGCCTLVRDRFKSLEKRGLVIPSKKSGRK